MDKNNLPFKTIAWKRRMALFCVLAMIGGMLFSRAIPSIAMMLLGITSLCFVNPKEWLKQRWWLFGLIWLGLTALTYFWTEDRAEWNAHLQVKLPFLLLPLCFGLLPRFSRQELRIYTWALCLIMLSGAVYSVSFFFRGNPADLLFQYMYAHVLPTPVYNDHIAFSSAVAVTIAWSIGYAPELPGRLERWLLIFACLLLAVYLHVLAAKTGLVAFYIFMAGYILYHFRKKALIAAGSLLLMGLLLFVAIVTVPTLRRRVGYSISTWRAYHSGERSGVYSDAGRVFSYDVALKEIAAHPIAGVGAGDVLHEMSAGYAKWYPQVAPEQQLWPHNQWLTCALAAGIPTAIFFTLWLIAPLLRIPRNRRGAFFVITWTMLLVPLMVDAFLEVQFGVAVFLIFLLMQWKYMRDSEPESALSTPADSLHPKDAITA